MFLFRSQERPYLCEETNFVCSVLLCHITLYLCFCISSVNWCTHVVLISYSLPPFDILIVYACTYVCILYAMLFVNPNFMYMTIKYLLTYLLTYLRKFEINNKPKHLLTWSDSDFRHKLILCEIRNSIFIFKYYVLVHI